jgi:hypothetical protein
VEVKDLAANVPVDDSLFTLEGMRIPPDAAIQDNTLNIRARRGGPFTLPEEFVQSVIGDDRAQRASPGTAERPAPTATAPRTRPDTPEPVAEPAPAAQEAASPLVWQVLAVGLGIILFCAAAGFLLASRARRPRGGMEGKTP